MTTRNLTDIVRNQMKDIAKKTTLADGVSLSIQASRFHYSTPRDDFGPYSAVEVGFIENEKGEQLTPPDEWKAHADGDFPNDVYGYIPVAIVERFIASHGGVKEGPGIPS
jgi:hypothetical protein